MSDPYYQDFEELKRVDDLIKEGWNIYEYDALNSRLRLARVKTYKKVWRRGKLIEKPVYEYKSLKLTPDEEKYVYLIKSIRSLSFQAHGEITDTAKRDMETIKRMYRPLLADWVFSNRMPIDDAVEILEDSGYHIDSYPEGIMLEVPDTFTPEELYEIVMEAIEEHSID